MSSLLTRNPNLDLCTAKSTEAEQSNLIADSSLQGTRPDWWWTGKSPLPGVCPGVREDGRISSLPLPNLNQCTRQEVLDYFDNTWTLTEVLFSSLQSEEAFYIPPYHQLRHPLIFYYCHPAVLYINKLRVAGILDAPLNEYFEQLFETGVDEMSWDDMSKNEMEWPSVKDVNEYRRQAYSTVRKVIETHPAFETLPIIQDSPVWAVFMGFEHERIHLETSSVLIRELPIHLLRRPVQWPSDYPSAILDISEKLPAHLPQVNVDYPANKMVTVPAGTVTLGKPYNWPTYGWDNEYGHRQERVRPFRASKYLISNGEFYQFVKDGGYCEQRYWTKEGWQWRQFRNAKWPTFWMADGSANLHQYKLRTCFEIIDMPWSWPAIINYHEAKAYCAWRTEKEGCQVPYRVITEAEHHRMRDRSCLDETAGTARDWVMFASGHDMVRTKEINLNLAYGSESSVDAMLPSSAGFYDTFGNVWEWCEDDFMSLPGFKVHYLYDDFSTPCFDGKHTIIMGGSFISTGDEASIWARFHFRQHFFQHAGFRLACSDDGDPTCDAVKLSQHQANGNVYETQQLLNEYLLLHYGSAEDVMPFNFVSDNAMNFPWRCAQLVVEWAAKLGINSNRALDIGCAVGRASFEMARSFQEVLGVDLSASFINAANTLKQRGSLEYFRKDEGDLGKQLTAVINPDIDRDRVTFRQADACALPPELIGFDAVLLANVICRLPSPKACLLRMGGPRGLVRPGGLLVITSPYTWMEQFTPKDVWLGGYERDGVPAYSFDGLRNILGQEFELVSEANSPLLIREHLRKYQYIVAHTTVWKRKKKHKLEDEG